MPAVSLASLVNCWRFPWSIVNLLLDLLALRFSCPQFPMPPMAVSIVFGEQVAGAQDEEDTLLRSMAKDSRVV
jgi:hypothetical protein